MLNLQPASLRATAHDTPPPSGGQPAGADPAGFASLLRQSQAAAPVPAPAPEKSAAPARAEADPAAPEPETDAAESTNPHSRTRAPVKARPRATETATAATPRGSKTDAATPTPDEKVANADTEAARSSDAVAAAPPPADAPIDPTVLHWLAGQKSNRGSADESAAATEPTDAVGADPDAPRGARRGPRAADLKADADDKPARGKAQAASGEAGVAAGRTEAFFIDKPQLPAASGVKNAEAAAPATLAAPATARFEAAAPVAVAVATPVATPDFARAFGLQMSVLARDGVQQAELHLNPAEMGPVSVQIVMDGSRAHVDFGADVAATRAAIEAGLPELASALRDAGFTLAGGGVSQHSRHRSDTDDARGTRVGRASRSQGDEAADAALSRVGTTARRIVSAGGVDVFV